MERHELLEMMRELQLSGMKAAYDEVLREALRCGHAIQRILGDLLKAELAEKRARSIRYRLAAAKLPLVKELAEFDFKASPVNAALVRDLHAGGLLTPPRNAVLVGGTGTGKSHLAPAPGFSTSSIWSISSRPKSARDRRASWRGNWRASTW
jgi:DNA replication protein DnaC